VKRPKLFYINMKRYIAGIDVGTTNIKGSLYDDEGKFIISVSSKYDSFSPCKNYHEQNPEDWFYETIKILKKLASSLKDKKALKAISFSTQGGTLVLTDKNMKPLCNAITWLDRRGVEVINSLKGFSDLNIIFYKKTGWRLDSCIGFLPLYWLKKNKPDLFLKIHKVMYVNDYLLYRLCGNALMDPSNASISLFYNVIQGKWDQDILEMAGFVEGNFSNIKESGSLAGYLKEDLKKK
jgi:xylulokinase